MGLNNRVEFWLSEPTPAAKFFETLVPALIDEKIELCLEGAIYFNDLADETEKDPLDLSEPISIQNAIDIVLRWPAMGGFGLISPEFDDLSIFFHSFSGKKEVDWCDLGGRAFKSTFPKERKLLEALSLRLYDSLPWVEFIVGGTEIEDLFHRPGTTNEFRSLNVARSRFEEISEGRKANPQCYDGVWLRQRARKGYGTP